MIIKQDISAVGKPFIKWAGGKGKLVSQLDEFLPENLGRHAFTYVEPFVGGGAMLFHMLQKYPNIKRVVINDINPYLTIAYRVVKENPEELINRLLKLANEYYALSGEEAQKTFFLDVRTIFNSEKLDDIDRTKYLIFLNRTCFNGLYRVNGKGHFNVPFGKYAHPTICNADVIRADSALLNSTEVVILNGDFEETINYLDEQGANFFYFDPPYRPLSATSSFTSYAKEDFNDEEQIRLRDFCQRLNGHLGIRWMLSNADCSAKNPEDRFFEEKYRDFFISRVYASRSINANPSKRGKLTELLISNYRPEGYIEIAAEDVEPYNRAI